MISRTQDREPQVLIIDDEPEICELITSILDKRHIQSTAVNHTGELASLIRDNEFEVIISDVDLPGMSGLDILRHVQNTCPNTKMILMTGHHESEWIQKALRGGAYDYLVKPFDLEQFYASVSGALQDRHIQNNTIDPRNLVDRYLNIVLDEAFNVQCVSGSISQMNGINPANIYGKHVDTIFECSQAGDNVDSPTSLASLLSGSSGVGSVTLSLSLGGEVPFRAEILINPVFINGKKPCYYLQVVDLSPVEFDNAAIHHQSGITNRRLKHDLLTGLANHIAFQEELRRTRHQCQRYGRCMSIVLIDIKDFHGINDKYGYAEGDRIIIELSNQIRKQVRLNDFLCRYAVNQFALILPETKGAGAWVMADRMCRGFEESLVPVGSDKARLSLVAGIVQCGSGFVESQAELLQRLSEALAIAKEDNGPKVTLWGGDADNADAFDHSSQNPAGKRFSTKGNNAREFRAVYMEMIRSLVAAVEAKDPYTKNHSFNVADYVEQLARRIGCAEKEFEIFRCAAILHDIGKIGIPDAILTKPGRLTDEEFEIIKSHSIIGENILGQNSFLSAEASMVRHHHERWDGKGYPDSLAGDAIPLGARLINICDAVDCMFNDRSYKDGYNLDKVVGELERNSGTQFDPKPAELMIEFLKTNPDKIHYPC
jgi:diguanylate cyclase (GGDEF)-like protein/putative nucleotidyltransferase with HDIG domain